MNIQAFRHSGIQAFRHSGIQAFRHSGILIVLVSIFACPQISFAFGVNHFVPGVTYAEAYVVAGGTFPSNGMIIQEQSHPNTTNLNINFSHDFGNGFSWNQGSSAYAFADFGVLKVLNTTTGNGGGVSSSIAGFGDSLLINAEGLSGHQGTLNIKLKIEYGFAATDGGLGSREAGRYGVSLSSGSSRLVQYGSPYSHNDYSFDLTASLECEGVAFCYRNTFNANSLRFTSSEITNHPFSNEYSLLIPFTYGEEFDIGIRAYSNATAVAGGSFIDSAMVVDSSHSFYWGGISQVLDEKGNTVSDFKISSESGTNYLQDFSVTPVPEPETYAMLLGGLGLAGVVARRRKFA